MAAKMENLENRESQITPGPWTVGRRVLSERLKKHEKSSVSMGGQVVIFAAAPDGAPYAEQVANARLISAAPELLEVCKGILPFLDDLMGQRCLQTAAKWGGTTFDLREDIRVAIAKAEGRA